MCWEGRPITTNDLANIIHWLKVDIYEYYLTSVNYFFLSLNKKKTHTPFEGLVLTQTTLTEKGSHYNTHERTTTKYKDTNIQYRPAEQNTIMVMMK